MIFLLRFWFLTNFFQINSSHKNYLNSLVVFIVSKLFENFEEIKIGIESRLRCIDIFDGDCIFQVFGIADERLGEELVAWIKEIPGSNLNSQDIKQFCKGKVKYANNNFKKCPWTR